jgi:hypothetical protein
MKKFFTLCAALLSTAATFAQESTTFSFVHDGQVVTNGSTLNITSADYNAIPAGDITFYSPQYNPHLYAKNNTNSEVTLVATIEAIVNDENGVYVGICAGGDCFTLTATMQSTSKTTTLAPGATLDLEIEAKGTATTQLSDVLAFENSHNSSTRVSLQVAGSTTDVTTITLNMGKKYETGLAHVASSTSKVALHGRTLNYNFGSAAARTLRVYNVSGAAVMSQTLSGAQGTVSLTSLPAGIYIYKLGDACGKVVLK